jgi:hypothetical protein
MDFMCGIVGTFSTEKENINIQVNEAAVCGTVAIGAGYTQLTEFCAALDTPVFSRKTYLQAEEKILDITEKVALEEMLAAGAEERALAIDAGEVDKDPYITVAVDGAWSKRSYKSNYNALSGVATIIGARTKKVLYVGVKNKYCKKCFYYKNLEKPSPVHKCFKNWKSTSTSMEAAIILDGFKQSLDMHKLRFKNLIGDGDSSVYKKIRNGRPYGPSYFVHKIECRNHILRNFCNKIREIAKTPRSDMTIRNFLKANYMKFRTSIVCAIRFSKNEHTSFEQKTENLTNDILNAPAHIFSDHSKCAPYFCKNVGQVTNVVEYSEFLNSSLFISFIQALKRVATLSSSLL